MKVKRTWLRQNSTLCAKKRLMHCNKQGYSMTSGNEAPVSAQARGDAPAQSKT
jgi:hypothetical protein